MSFKCNTITQRDSIASDLINRGCIKEEIEAEGLYIFLQTDHTFWFTKTDWGTKRANTVEELYANAKEKKLNKKNINSSEENLNADIKEDICSEINIHVDKFTGEETYNSPDVDDISFIRVLMKGKISQYVSISLYDSYLAGANNTGLIILFKSGKKIIRNNEKIDVDLSTNLNWRYSVFFTPTLKEINLLTKDEIIGVKMYIFDNEIKQGSKIKNFANCLLIPPKVSLKKK